MGQSVQIGDVRITVEAIADRDYNVRFYNSAGELGGTTDTRYMGIYGATPFSFITGPAAETLEGEENPRVVRYFAVRTNSFSQQNG